MKAGEKLDAMLINVLRETVSYGKVSIKDDNLVFEYNEPAVNILNKLNKLRDIIRIGLFIFVLFYLFTIIINPSNFDFQVFKHSFRKENLLPWSFFLIGIVGLFERKIILKTELFKGFRFYTNFNIKTFSPNENYKYVILVDDHTNNIFTQKKYLEVIFNIDNLLSNINSSRMFLLGYFSGFPIIFWYLMITNKLMADYSFYCQYVFMFLILVNLIIAFGNPWGIAYQSKVVKKFYKFL